MIHAGSGGIRGSQIRTQVERDCKSRSAAVVNPRQGQLIGVQYPISYDPLQTDCKSRPAAFRRPMPVLSPASHRNLTADLQSVCTTLSGIADPRLRLIRKAPTSHQLTAPPGRLQRWRAFPKPAPKGRRTIATGTPVGGTSFRRASGTAVKTTNPATSGRVCNCQDYCANSVQSADGL